MSTRAFSLLVPRPSVPMRLTVVAAGLACATGFGISGGFSPTYDLAHALERGAPVRAVALLSSDITRSAPAPHGADPYKLVYDDLEFIKESIKRVLKQKNSGSGAAIKSNDVLSMAAREFMQRKGKSFRPMLVLLVGTSAS